MAERYGVPEGLEVTWFERLRYAGGEPLALMHNAVPTAVLPLDRADLERTGLYELLRAAGHVPRMATQVVGARAANAAEARVLRREPRRAPAHDEPHRVGREGRGRRVRRPRLPREPLLVRAEPHGLSLSEQQWISSGGVYEQVVPVEIDLSSARQGRGGAVQCGRCCRGCGR